MKLLKSLSRLCSSSKKVGLTERKHFTQLQAKQLMNKPNPLRDVLLEHIQKFGELSLERYWKTALTDSQLGYYSKKNVFSKEGDFTTSPEISPLFGEMIGVWITYFLRKTKIFDEVNQVVNKKFRIVELGGGRGLLMKDIVRTFSDLKISNNFDINFVQVSEYNRKAQQDSLLQQFKSKQHFFKFQHEKATNKYESFVSENQDKNVSLVWFETIEELFYHDAENQKNGHEIPLTVFVMNQFMDALPVTILKYTSNGWRQKVLNKSKTQNMFFQFCLSERQLPQKMIPIADNIKEGDEVQVSHVSLLTMDLLAKTIQKHGGAILNIDYGDEGSFENSIRAIKDHKFIPSPYFWQVPGECDLSAYVNFSALALFAQKNQGIKAYQAIPQGYFLQAMGIVPRVDNLKKNLKQEQQDRIQSEYLRLVLPQNMGEIYKVQIITKKQYGQIYPHVQDNQHSF